MREIYGVRLMREVLEIEVLGMKQELKLRWWDGMIGAMPLFGTKEEALSFADGDENKIFTMIVSEGRR